MPPLEDSGIHLHRAPHAASPETDAVVHWSLPVGHVPTRSLLAPVEDALAHIALCVSHDDAMVIWESAMRTERLFPEALRRVEWTSVAARACAAEVTGLSDSGLETIVVVKLRPWGLRIRQQVFVADHRVDLLVGDRLIVQVDGFEFHSTPADRRRDAEHDAELVLRGYTVLRFTYAQVVYDWPAVERTIARAIAAGSHRAA